MRRQILSHDTSLNRISWKNNYIVISYIFVLIKILFEFTLFFGFKTT